MFRTELSQLVLVISSTIVKDIHKGEGGGVIGGEVPPFLTHIHACVQDN